MVEIICGFFLAFVSMHVALKLMTRDILSGFGTLLCHLLHVM